jgi:glycosyltransferase involved in cell wall biosynthesis
LGEDTAVAGTDGAQRAARRWAAHVPATRADALAEFRAAARDVELPPVVVVIAAFDEAGAIGDVVRAIPAEACGLATAALVVDDGSTDGTATVAQAAGARVARLWRNCGHGVALRVGYQLAREYGARFIVTVDGDGQWDPAELETVLEPVAAGEADLVLGSRVLGRSEIDQRLRLAGVRVFAALTRLLTGARVTDTSTGYRAMRVDVTASVRQEQPQYQTAELLIGAILRGYRVAERPIVQRRRMAGETKKGNDVLYGLRYARVILTTWWRDRRAYPKPVPGGVRRSRCGL